jgi:uncharacterized Rmd1/YagE family protein
MNKFSATKSLAKKMSSSELQTNGHTLPKATHPVKQRLLSQQDMSFDGTPPKNFRRKGSQDTRFRDAYGKSDGETRNIKILKRARNKSINPVVELEERRRIAAFTICEKIDIKKAKKIFQNKGSATEKEEVLIVEFAEAESLYFIFDFGVVVFWNEQESNELAC